MSEAKPVTSPADYADAIVQALREPLIVIDADLGIRAASRSFYETFKVAPEQTIGRRLYEIGNRQWDIPELRKLLDEVLSTREQFDDFQVDRDFASLGRRTMLLNARRIQHGDADAKLILLAIEDITERRRAEHLIEISEVRYRRLFEAAHDGILILNTNTRRITDVNPFLMKLLDYPREHFIGKELWEIGIFQRQRSQPARHAGAA